MPLLHGSFAHKDNHMNSRPSLEIASLTDAGMSRSNNEDRHAVDAGTGFAILADGMGATVPAR